jgi:PAS domain S-box-containing protein
MRRARSLRRRSEPELREIEALFRSAFEDAPIGMAITAIDGTFLEVNRALCDLLGRSAEDLRTFSWADVTHPEDRAVQEAYEDSALAGNARFFRTEKRYLRPDGRTVWALLSRSLIESARGEPGVFISQVVDITDRRRVEQRIREQEEETRRIIESAQEAFVGMDADGRIIEWNRQAELTFGWRRDEALGRRLADTIVPERYRDAHWRGLERFLRTGEAEVLGKRLEYSALRRDGTEFPVELAIWTVPSGGGVLFHALVHDIADRKRAEHVLRRQKEELAALHETTLGLLNRLDAADLLETILSRAAALLGTPHACLYVVDEDRGELVIRAGTGVFTDYVGYRLGRGEGLAGRVWETGQPLMVDDYSTWSGRRAGFEFLRAAAAIPLATAAKIEGVLGLVLLDDTRRFEEDDIGLLSRFGRMASLALENARLYSTIRAELAERTRAEKELERTAAELQSANRELRVADAMKSDFVAIASHELRTPLTAVLGFASTLLTHWDRLPEEERRSQVGMIDRQARVLGRLVDDLLTMSRIEGGALETQPRAVDVRASVEDLLVSVGCGDDEVAIDVDDELEVLADPSHLRQIVTNYLTNALKYGRTPIRVEAAASDGSVEIRVRDQGDGVPEDFVPRLFEKFAQAPGIAQAHRGTGLGLSIVLGLARAQGGDAWYEPNQPRGACFGVRLPRAG